MIKKKNYNRFIKIFVLVLNIVGIICLIYFSIPFVTHDMSIPNPNAMLAGYSWDSCGFVLTLGLIPLIVANTMAYIFINTKKKILKVLFYIPSLICLILVAGYLFMSFTEEKDEYIPELISSAKCEIKGKVYHYSLYKEKDGSYSSAMDENDKMTVEVINYDSPEKWIESIEKYYKDNGGMCP